MSDIELVLALLNNKLIEINKAIELLGGKRYANSSLLRQSHAIESAISDIEKYTKEHIKAS